MHPLRFGVVVPQSTSWDKALARWRWVEELGFDCAAVTDHFMPTSGDLEGWFHEGCTLLTALAVHSHRLRVALLVAGNTYRNPALLAKHVVTLDHITGGRVELGIGAAWNENDHLRYGWPLPPAGERVAMLDEALTVIRSLLSEQRTIFDGVHYQLRDAPFQPKAIQQRLPIMVGGQRPHMMRLVARHADIWSIDHGPQQMRASGELLCRACAAIGRDPAELRWCAFAIASRIGRDPWDSLDDFATVVQDYMAVGVTEIYFRWPTSEQLGVFEQAAALMAELRAARDIDG
jgi:alkanesulfonate monooxygenase SsuD/methylene tetrahydromethanopterin reductase-like flavin-dependent oxidoreductase (luciferase family)